MERKEERRDEGRVESTGGNENRVGKDWKEWRGQERREEERKEARQEVRGGKERGGKRGSEEERRDVRGE